MKKSFLGIIVGGLLFGSSSFALPGEHNHFDRMTTPRQEESKPEVVSGEGLVQCDGGCYGDMESCDLEFVRDDGEVFDLVNDDALKALHCQNHSRNLKVKLDGQMTSQFLFWGGNLKLANYEVTGAVASANCQKERPEFNREFGGAWDRR